MATHSNILAWRMPQTEGLGSSVRHMGNFHSITLS